MILNICLPPPLPCPEAAGGTGRTARGMGAEGTTCEYWETSAADTASLTQSSEWDRSLLAAVIPVDAP